MPGLDTKIEKRHNFLLDLTSFTGHFEPACRKQSRQVDPTLGGSYREV